MYNSTRNLNVFQLLHTSARSGIIIVFSCSPSGGQQYFIITLTCISLITSPLLSPGSHYVVQAGFKFRILLLQPHKVGITGLYHHAWLRASSHAHWPWRRLFVWSACPLYIFWTEHFKEGISTTDILWLFFTIEHFYLFLNTFSSNEDIYMLFHCCYCAILRRSCSRCQWGDDLLCEHEA